MIRVDLRSDTVTRPTPEMRRAMAEAEVGDACFGDDPTVNRLEKMAAERLGKEAALFVPTGSMSNQIAVAALSRPGSAAIVEARSHIARWEGAGAAVHAGVQLLTVEAEDGLPTIAAMEAVATPDSSKAPPVRLVSFENTHNAAGGIPHPAAALSERRDWARSRGFAVHLDGARLFHAAVATGDAPEALAGAADTVNVCLSKGLGAPVGSIFAGTREVVREADRIRHRLGGGWRQAGVLAAAGIFALERHVERLAEDHARAARIAAALAASGVATPAHAVRTNLVCYRVDPEWGTADDFTRALAERGIAVFSTGRETGRLVTHLDVDDRQVDHVVSVLASL